ncbi:glycoside hydrolase family 25 protein [Mesorhizobium sp.]|uniref:glycoside hydrolase family 25 protein n=1 Tax=Mesorhizobium sp. TaxID=1871066 RepID=UPI000FE52331|nr:glycoside hydrolase family 25 protein [Mesorhizobium sp.]RWP05090.1 MAG: cell-wall lytic protein [Mesorhizobium sp.]
MPSAVIDLSHHNPTPDWIRIRSAGVLGVIHKATEGTTYVDPQRETRLAAAKKAGLLTATYHFLRPGDMTKQMAHYLKTVDPVEGERMILDHEDANVSLAQLERAVGTLLASRPDLQITIYSGALIKQQLGSTKSDLGALTSLWIAQYTNAAAPTWPRQTWPQWSLWQWTDKENVPGIAAPVDGNRWNGDEAGLERWLAPAGAKPVDTAVPPPPEPAPAPEPPRLPVVIDIAMPPGTEIDIVVNGKMLVSE